MRSYDPSPWKAVSTPVSVWLKFYTNESKSNGLSFGTELVVDVCVSGRGAGSSLGSEEDEDDDESAEDSEEHMDE